MGTGNRGACERGDGAPRLIGGDSEMALRPLPQAGNRRRPADEAKIELSFVHWSLTGVTFSKKLQYDAVAKVLRQRDVRLQSDAFARGARQQVAQPCNCGVASICGYQSPGLKILAGHGRNFPIAIVMQGCDDSLLANQGANFASAPQHQIIEQAAFYRNLAIVPSWNIDNDFVTVDRDELHRGELGVRQSQNPTPKSETLQYRPTRWI